MLPYLADAVLIAVLVFGFWHGVKKGLARGVYKLAAFFAAAVLVFVLQDNITAAISAGKFAGNLHDQISATITGMLPQTGEITAESLSFLPDYIARAATAGAGSGTVSMVADNIAAHITTLFIRIIVCVGLFIIIRLLISVGFLIVDAVFKIPVLKQANSIGGGLLGLINTVLILYVVLGIAAVIFVKQGSWFDDTLVVKYFYSQNLLMKAVLALGIGA